MHIESVTELKVAEEFHCRRNPTKMWFLSLEAAERKLEGIKVKWSGIVSEFAHVYPCHASESGLHFHICARGKHKKGKWAACTQEDVDQAQASIQKLKEKGELCS